MTHRTHSVEEMYALAVQLLPLCVEARTVLLSGPLGAGKTTFAQGIGRALGAARPLRSPTFALLAEYRVEHPDIDRLVHADLYRLPRAARRDIRLIGLDEALNDERALVLIEWPERLETLLAGMRISFEIDGDDRLVEISTPTGAVGAEE